MLADAVQDSRVVAAAENPANVRQAKGTLLPDLPHRLMSGEHDFAEPRLAENPSDGYLMRRGDNPDDRESRVARVDQLGGALSDSLDAPPRSAFSDARDHAAANSVLSCEGRPATADITADVADLLFCQF